MVKIKSNGLSDWGYENINYLNDKIRIKKDKLEVLKREIKKLQGELKGWKNKGENNGEIDSKAKKVDNTMG